MSYRDERICCRDLTLCGSWRADLCKAVGSTSGVRSENAIGQSGEHLEIKIGPPEVLE